jgi:hypothetical protein
MQYRLPAGPDAFLPHDGHASGSPLFTATGAAGAGGFGADGTGFGGTEGRAGAAGR